MDRKVYLDHTSATALDPKVLEAMVPYFTEIYGNPQSMHDAGEAAKNALEESRQRVAEFLGGEASEIIFTSSGTEANNLAIKGLADAYQNKGNHIIVSSIEHYSILHPSRSLEKSGFKLTQLPVDSYGTVDPDDLKKAITKDTILVSIQHANPEVGTIQSLEELSLITRERGIPLHSDAIASAGLLPLDVKRLGADLLTIAPHQFYGPKGIGALYVKKGIRLRPIFEGGVQESGRRAGTEPVPLIVGFAKACEIAKNNMASLSADLAFLRDRIINETPKLIEYCHLNGHPQRRLPNNVHLSIEFVEGESMVLFLNMEGIAVSTGSACSSRALKTSHVLQAMKLDPVKAQGSLLISLGKDNSGEDITYLLDKLPPIVKRLRNMSPLYADKVKKPLP
ncbi:MAG: cysteine desulfurase family protein [bacterium]|nr:cysteine desulfurase family protein [bacterium]